MTAHRSSLAPASAHDSYGARAVLVLAALIWGVNYVATKVALVAFPPWTFRTLSYAAGAGLLILWARYTTTRLGVARPKDRLHLIVSGLFTCAGFGAFSALALLYTSTGRAAICAYTMPIWVALLGRIVLKEALTPERAIALALCSVGLTILLWPLVSEGVSLGALFAIGSAISWAIGTVYLKWAKVSAPSLAVATWQLLAGAAGSAIGMLVEGPGLAGPVGLLPALGLAYGVVAGTAIAYLLWFRTLERLPASTAGLGTLLVPVFGLAASVLLLGERPTSADLVGFGVILAAAAAALRVPARPEAA